MFQLGILSLADGAYPQNYVVEQRRYQVTETHFDKFPLPSTCQCWTSFKTAACSCSCFPSEAVRWIKEVEMVDSVDDLKTSQSIRGHRFPNFEVNLAEQKAQLDDRFLRGRQIAFMMSTFG